MIKKILIANRGEIACRIIKTAKKMGISTVAVYSDADKNSLHTRIADESVHIGNSESSNSYLSFEKIMNAIKLTNADSVHPGYGFLSENADFASLLEKNKIVFIGPPSEAIKKMGDKIESKKIALNAGVSTVPGYIGEIKDVEHAKKISSDIGFPLMIKASAGGGGKGMRVVNKISEIEESFLIASNEAKKSFNDDRLFLEKFIVNPHHIEIQILGDTFGNFVYFGERECSIQRRNQKVIEEAPSPFLSKETREKMGMQAISLAKEVNYFSAGTVEFIVDERQNFYFLEMNTRLQVEHPVTELVYNVDLVEQMIKVASSEKLNLNQTDIKIRGHSIESRIYAEDPFKSFLPSTGRLKKYKPPLECSSNIEVIRNDTGVYEGGEISIFYDPMISKLCTWAKDRELASNLMKRSLDVFEIEGINHNIPFLSAVLNNRDFENGNYTTSFIEKNYPSGFKYVEPKGNLKKCMEAFAASTFLVIEKRKIKSLQNKIIDDNFIKNLSMINENKKNEIIISQKNNSFLFEEKENNLLEFYSDWVPGKSIAKFKSKEFEKIFKFETDGINFIVYYREFHLKLKIFESRLSQYNDLMISNNEESFNKIVYCPMPGLLVSFFIKEGDQVQEGDSLCIVEAMKMENIIKADRNGIINKIKVFEGDTLSVNQVILEYE